MASTRFIQHRKSIRHVRKDVLKIPKWEGEEVLENGRKIAYFTNCAALVCLRRMYRRLALL
jgi:hypothetical protein